MTKKCTQCNHNIKDVPFAVSEAEATRQHKTIKYLIIGWIITIVLLFGSNLAWVVYNNQFETVEETVTETFDIIQDTKHGSNNCSISR